MVTSKSPRAVMRAAHALAGGLFDEHAHRFSRKDFTLPQLFACLVPREHQRKSYRGVEALLRDCSDLRDAVGLGRAPDHNTLWRAFTHLVKPSKMNRASDLQVAAARAEGLKVTGDSIKPAVLDGTCFESRHVSRHFEKRQRQSAKPDRKRAARRVRPEKGGSRGEVRRRPPPVADGQAAAQAVVGRRGRLVPPDPRRPGHHRPGRRPPALRAAAVRRLAAGRRQGRRRRRRVRLGGQPPDRAAGHGRADGHPAGHRPPRRQAADDALPAVDAPAIQSRGGQGDLRPALASRDGEQHDQAEPRPRAACPHRPAAAASMELLLRCITHNVLVLEGTEP
jgi:hypothetical protein